jgi:hypothetical protein
MSRQRIDVDVSTLGSASHTERLRAEVGRESPDKGAVEMREAQDAAAAYARAALEQVHAAAALVAVGGQLRVPEDSEFRHGDERVASICRRLREVPYAESWQASYLRARRGSSVNGTDH